jgi:AmiR/NasT family two-component response regulator
VTATHVTASPVDTPDSVGSVEDLQRENEQLRTALATRIVIEQAKGMLAERLQVEIEVAFERLRRETRNRRMKLHAVAAAVVAREPWTHAIFSSDATGDPR